MAAERRPIPLRPDADLLRADTLTSLARAIIARTTACLGHQRERDEPSILRSRFTGHASLSEVQRYTKAADRKRMAREAMNKLVEGGW